ncbi:hypothetical protein NX059_012045 [Plenodomus lindquistii]|nr:hypothetical protein NX059_012045 [Plenodomus lindquistii]
MPTDTPSPHRFLAPRAAAQPSKLKPPSGLRNVLAVQTPKAAIATRPPPDAQLKKVTPARRFVLPPSRPAPSAETPVKAKETEPEPWKDAPAQETPRPKPRRKFERVESIQDSSQSSAVGTQDDPNGEGVVQSIEQDGTIDNNTHDDEEEMLFAPSNRNHKRRRISPPSSPSIRPDTAPQTPLPSHTSTSHRFKPLSRAPGPFASIASTFTTPLPNSHTTPGPAPTPAPHRPHFVLPPPPTSPPKPSKPLPEIFSPSRKHGKYIPNGLASTMTSWIIEAAGTGYAAQERGSGGVVWGRERDDGVKVRVRADHVSRGAVEEGGDEMECFSGSVVFVRGEVDHERYNASRVGSIGDEDGVVRVLLAGQGGARGSGGVRIRKGGVVGIRAPLWEVDVSGEVWTVGVDWVVL